MTTKKFIEEVNKLGYRTEVQDVNIYVKKNDDVALYIYGHNQYALDANWSNNRELLTRELFDLAVEYAKTHPKDRKEPELYYLRANEVIDECEAYLNYDKVRRNYFLAGKEEFGKYVTKFTEEDIKGLPMWCQYLDKIEVKE